MSPGQDTTNSSSPSLYPHDRCRRPSSTLFRSHPVPLDRHSSSTTFLMTRSTLRRTCANRCLPRSSTRLVSSGRHIGWL